jgi:surface protein
MASAFDTTNPAYSADVQASILHFNQDLSSWDTSAVTNMSQMFRGASGFNNGGQPLATTAGGWNTSLVTTMFAMFRSCAAFNQDVSSWDTHSVIQMNQMFRGATMFNNGANPGVGGVPFTRTPGSIWDTGAVVDMSTMFNGCAAFNQDVSSWDTHSVENMAEMFLGATTFNNGANPGVGGVPFTRTPDSIWDTGQVVNMTAMFGGCAAFNQDVSSWDTHSVINMSYMFYGATTFNNGADPGVGGVPFTRTPNSIWDTGVVVYMFEMFYGCEAFNQDVSSWDTHSVTLIDSMFLGAKTFNNGLEPGVGGAPFTRTPDSIWDTGAVTNMNAMFRQCPAFNQNVSSWDTHSVTDMSGMFLGATTFNNGADPGVGGVPFTTLGNIWNTGAVLNMAAMFRQCPAFNQNVSSWDTHSVTIMTSMFLSATTFNNGADPGVGGVPFTRTPDSIWDTGRVFDMREMFNGCQAFNQDVSSWDTHLVTTMTSMFLGATTFNNGAEPGVGGVPFTTLGNIWNTGAVVNMLEMFRQCPAFNQNVSSWDTHSVTDMRYMFEGATLFTGTGLDGWQLTLKPNIVEMFVNSGVPGSVNNNLIWNTWKTRYAYLTTELAAAGLIEPTPTPTPTPTPLPMSNICFPAGTPIQTDQGIVTIEKLDTRIHTINKKAIQHITQTVTLDKYLIRFEKHALNRNCPTQNTIMTKDHQIVFEGRLVPAYRFLDYSDKVKKVTYNGETLYNVLLQEHSVMTVNNLTCETLHPTNIIAKLYTNNYTVAEKHDMIMQLNTALVERDLPGYKKIIQKLHTF